MDGTNSSRQMTCGASAVQLRDPRHVYCPICPNPFSFWAYGTSGLWLTICIRFYSDVWTAALSFEKIVTFAQ